MVRPSSSAITTVVPVGERSVAVKVLLTLLSSGAFYSYFSCKGGGCDAGCVDHVSLHARIFPAPPCSLRHRRLRVVEPFRWTGELRHRASSWVL